MDNGMMWPVHPITAAGPRWIFTTFPFHSAWRKTCNRVHIQMSIGQYINMMVKKRKRENKNIVKKFDLILTVFGMCLASL